MGITRMSLLQYLAKKLVTCFLAYEKEQLRVRLEYHYQMAQLCEELIVKNHMRLEAKQ